MKQKSKQIQKTKLSANTLNNNKSSINKKNIKIKHINRAISSEPKAIKNFKSKQKIKTEERNLKQSQDIIQRYDNNVKYSMNLPKEKKMKNSINRLIDTSQNLLKQQNDILNKTESLMQNVEMNNHEIEKIIRKENKQKFCKNVESYNQNLTEILSKLKQNTQEIQFSNKMKDENNNLKYRMQMLSIDKNDDFRNIQNELNSLKNIYSNEMNSILRYLYELGFDNISLGNIKSENITQNLISNFFDLIKSIIEQLKKDLEEKEGQIELLKKMNDLNNYQKNNIDNIVTDTDKYKIKSLGSDINLNNDKILNSNYSSIENYKNSINNNRIKKIEDLCLIHTYDIDNIKEEKNDNNESKTYFDNFQRSKNIIKNELNNKSDLGIQLENNYTDSNFYPNVKESLTNNKDYEEINNDNNIKGFFSRTNESQPMNKFV